MQEQSKTAVTLCIALPSNDIDPSLMGRLESSFALYITQLTESSDIVGYVRHVSSTSDLLRAESSTKMLKFVDRRSCA